MRDKNIDPSIEGGEVTLTLEQRDTLEAGIEEFSDAPISDNEWMRNFLSTYFLTIKLVSCEYDNNHTHTARV